MKKEKKVETVQEEIVEEDIKTNNDSSNIIEITQGEKENPFTEVIEKERHGLFALYRKTSRFNTIIMIVVVATFIASFIMMSQPVWGMPVCWSLIGVTLIGLVIYYIFTRKLYPKASKNYFEVFWKATNEFIFSSKDFSECKIDTTERYVLPEVIADKVYKDVIDTASRNIVHGKYKNEDFTFGELAFYKPGMKKRSREVIFVGRHLAIKNNFKFEGRYIVNIRGEKPTDLPNDIEDLKELVSQNLFVIYGPEGGNPEKDLGKDLIENLKSIECKGCLLNVNIVFWAGRTAAYISYDDDIVAIPFEKEIQVSSYEYLKKNVHDLFEILNTKKGK